jgi:polysaccharide biosynthesis protein VpsQ
MSARVKFLAAIYILILAGIVVLANNRETQYLFKPVRRLPYGDKIAHFLLMGVFSFLVNLVLRARNVRFWKFSCLLGSLMVLAVVAAEEFSQIFIPRRTFAWADLAADFLGIIVFGELARLLCRRRLRTASSFSQQS